MTLTAGVSYRSACLIVLIISIIILFVFLLLFRCKTSIYGSYYLSIVNFFALLYLIGNQSFSHLQVFFVQSCEFCNVLIISRMSIRKNSRPVCFTSLEPHRVPCNRACLFYCIILSPVFSISFVSEIPFDAFEEVSGPG